MNSARPRPLERSAFGALIALLLAPVIAQGLWRPTAHLFGTTASSAHVTLASLLVAGSVTVAAWLRPDAPSRAMLAGGVTAVLSAAALTTGSAGLVALLGVAAVLGSVAPRMASRLPGTMDGLLARHPRWSVAYVFSALVAMVSVARVSVFMGDPSRVDMQALPGERFVETHSCLTAYVRAAALARQRVDNLYADPWWYGSLGLPPRPTGSAPLYPPFELDNFSYPPPFLLLTSPLAPLEGDFLAQRALWFGLNGLLLALGLWVVARWIDGRGAHRALLLAPLFFGSVPVLVTLQIGNFHLASVVLAVLAMVAFDVGRCATGGAMLAATILSKVSPGVLGVMMLARRRFRDAAYAAGFGALLVAVSALVSGTEPLKSFVRFALPRLSSGAAFPFMATETGLITNIGPFGIPFKLRRLGFDVGDPWHVAPWCARAYTLALVALAFYGARHAHNRRDRAVTWLALLSLAALQSPFSPGYATLGLLWATTLLAAEVRSVRSGLALAVPWFVVVFAPPGLSTEFRLLVSLAQTAVVVGGCAWLVARAPRDVGDVDRLSHTT